MASGRGGLGSKITCSKITRNADIRSTTRSTTVMVSVRIILSSWELPIVSAYRNRTDDLRITRGTRRGCARASCTDSTGDRTDGTRGAGIIRRPGPRTGPRPRPCVPGMLLLCVNAADDMDPRPRADRAPGLTVDLHAATHTVRLADVRICRRQGLPGLPWCAGVPVRRACRTGTVPLAWSRSRVTAQGVNGSPAGTPGCRRARGPGSGMAGLPAGCLRSPGDPGPGGGRQPGIIE